MAEKAVLTDDGEIVLFYLMCDVTETALWRPYGVPLSSRSKDGGETWTTPEPVCEQRGRIYDAVHHDGEIRALFTNDATLKLATSEHAYELYTDAHQVLRK